MLNEVFMSLLENYYHKVALSASQSITKKPGNYEYRKDF